MMILWDATWVGNELHTVGVLFGRGLFLDRFEVDANGHGRRSSRVELPYPCAQRGVDDRPWRIAIDGMGKLAAIATQGGALERFDASGSRTPSWQLPRTACAWMAVRPEGFVAVLHDPFGSSNQRDLVAARWGHEPVSLLQFESAAFGVILHPSNGRLVFADQSGTVSCWQTVADNGKPVWSRPVGGATGDDVRALTGEVWLDLEGPLAFAGESIACLGNRLLLLDADTGAVTRNLGKVPQSSHSLAASADGRWLAVLGFSELRVWDLTTEESRSLKLDAMDPNSPMAVGPDSLLILGQQGFQLVRLNSADLTIEPVDFDGWDYQNWRAA